MACVCEGLNPFFLCALSSEMLPGLSEMRARGPFLTTTASTATYRESLHTVLDGFLSFRQGYWVRRHLALSQGCLSFRASLYRER